MADVELLIGVEGGESINEGSGKEIKDAIQAIMKKIQESDIAKIKITPTLDQKAVKDISKKISDTLSGRTLNIDNITLTSRARGQLNNLVGTARVELDDIVSSGGIRADADSIQRRINDLEETIESYNNALKIHGQTLRNKIRDLDERKLSGVDFDSVDEETLKTYIAAYIDKQKKGDVKTLKTASSDDILNDYREDAQGFIDNTRIDLAVLRRELADIIRSGGNLRSLNEADGYSAEDIRATSDEVEAISAETDAINAKVNAIGSEAEALKRLESARDDALDISHKSNRKAAGLYKKDSIYDLYDIYQDFVDAKSNNGEFSFTDEFLTGVLVDRSGATTSGIKNIIKRLVDEAKTIGVSKLDDTLLGQFIGADLLERDWDDEAQDKGFKRASRSLDELRNNLTRLSELTTDNFNSEIAGIINSMTQALGSIESGGKSAWSSYIEKDDVYVQAKAVIGEFNKLREDIPNLGLALNAPVVSDENEIPDSVTTTTNAMKDAVAEFSRSEEITEDIGLTQEEIVEKIRQENEEIAKGNALFRERLVYLRDGVVAASYKGMESTVDGAKPVGANYAIHTHSGILNGADEPLRRLPSDMDLIGFIEQGIESFLLIVQNEAAEYQIPAGSITPEFIKPLYKEMFGIANSLSLDEKSKRIDDNKVAQIVTGLLFSKLKEVGGDIRAVSDYNGIGGMDRIFRNEYLTADGADTPESVGDLLKRARSQADGNPQIAAPQSVDIVANGEKVGVDGAGKVTVRVELPPARWEYGEGREAEYDAALKSWQEANPEKNAEDYFVKNSTWPSGMSEGAIEAAKRIEARIAKLEKEYPLNPGLSKGFRVGEFESVKQLMGKEYTPSTTAVGMTTFNPKTRELVLGFRYLEKLSRTAARSENLSGNDKLSNADKTPEGVASHEYGHALATAIKSELNYGNSSAQELETWFESLSKTKITNGISKYAASSFDEFMAECFSELQTSSPRPMALKFKEYFDRILQDSLTRTANYSDRRGKALVGYANAEAQYKQAKQLFDEAILQIDNSPISESARERLNEATNAFKSARAEVISAFDIERTKGVKINPDSLKIPKVFNDVLREGMSAAKEAQQILDAMSIGESGVKTFNALDRDKMRAVVAAQNKRNEAKSAADNTPKIKAEIKAIEEQTVAQNELNEAKTAVDNTPKIESETKAIEEQTVAVKKDSKSTKKRFKTTDEMIAEIFGSDDESSPYHSKTAIFSPKRNENDINDILGQKVRGIVGLPIVNYGKKEADERREQIALYSGLYGAIRDWQSLSDKVAASPLDSMNSEFGIESSRQLQRAKDRIEHYINSLEDVGVSSSQYESLLEMAGKYENKTLLSTAATTDKFTDAQLKSTLKELLKLESAYATTPQDNAERRSEIMGQLLAKQKEYNNLLDNATIYTSRLAELDQMRVKSQNELAIKLAGNDKLNKVNAQYSDIEAKNLLGGSAWMESYDGGEYPSDFEPAYGGWANEHKKDLTEVAKLWAECLKWEQEYRKVGDSGSTKALIFEKLEAAYSSYVDARVRAGATDAEVASIEKNYQAMLDKSEVDESRGADKKIAAESKAQYDQVKSSLGELLKLESEYATTSTDNVEKRGELYNQLIAKQAEYNKLLSAANLTDEQTAELDTMRSKSQDATALKLAGANDKKNISDAKAEYAEIIKLQNQWIALEKKAASTSDADITKADRIDLASKAYERYVSAVDNANLTDEQRTKILKSQNTAQAEIEIVKKQISGKNDTSVDESYQKYSDWMTQLSKSSLLADGALEKLKDEFKALSDAQVEFTNSKTSENFSNYEAAAKNFERLYKDVLNNQKIINAFNSQDVTGYSATNNGKFTAQTEQLRAYQQQLENVAKLRAEIENKYGGEFSDGKISDEAAAALRNYSTEYSRLIELFKQAKTAQAQANGANSEALGFDKLANKVRAYYLQVKDVINKNPELLNQLNELMRKLSARDFTSVSEAADEFQKLQYRIREAGAETESFSQKLARMFKEKAGYGFVTRALMLMRQALKEVYNNVKEVDASMAQLKIVTGSTDSQMESFFAESAQLAQELGASITDVLGSIETFARLGYSAFDSKHLAEYAGILANVAAVDVDEATTGLTSIIKGYDLEVSDAEHVADVLIEVGQKYAISAGELMEGFERAGAALDASGTDFEKSSALLAAGNAAIQNAATVGTAFKAVSARIRGATSDLEDMGESTDDLAQGFSKYRDEILALTGFDIMADVDTGEYKDIYDIFVGLADVWDKLSDTTQSRVAEILGGTRQLSVIAGTINNISDATGAYEAAMNSAGVATKSNAIYMDTVDAKWNQLSATFQEFSVNLLDSGIVKGFIDIANGGLQAVNALQEFNLLLPTLAAGFAALQLRNNTKSNIPIVKSNVSLLNGLNLDIPLGTSQEDRYKILASSLDGLTAAQQRAVVSASNLDKVTQQGVNSVLESVRSGELLTAQTTKQILMQSGLSKAEADTIISTMGLKTATGQLTVAQRESVIQGLQQAFANGQIEKEAYDAAMALIAEKTAMADVSNSAGTLGAALKLAFSDPVTWISLAISAISLLTPVIQKAYKSTGELIDAGQTARETVSSITSEFESNSSTIESLSDSYAKLAQGVNQSTWENESLSTEDYDEFLGIANQIGEILPEHVRYFDAEGNAVLDLAGDTDTLTASLEELITQMREAANVEIAEQLDDIFKGSAARVSEYKGEINDLNVLIRGLVRGELYNDAESAELLSKYGIGYALGGEGLSAGQILELDTANYSSQIYDAVSQLQAEREKLESKIASEYSSLGQYFYSWLSTDSNFVMLADDVRNALQEVVYNINWSDLGIDNADDAKSWITDNLTKGLAAVEDVMDAYSGALDMRTLFESGEASYADYKGVIDGLVSALKASALSDEVKSQVGAVFGDLFNVDDVTPQVNKIKNVLSDELEGYVEGMSLEDIEIGYEIVADAENGGMSVEEFEAKVDELRNTKIVASFSIKDYETDIDNLQSDLKTLKSALENIESGDIEADDVIDLVQEFPTLLDSLDSSEEGFTSLTGAIKRMVKSKGDKFIEEMTEKMEAFKEAGDDAGAKGIENLIKLMEELGDTSEAALDGAIDQFGNYKKAIDAASEAYSDFQSKLEAHDYSGGFEDRVEAYDKMVELYNNGWGVTQLRDYMDYLGVEGDSRDDVKAWIKKYGKLYKTTDDGDFSSAQQFFKMLQGIKGEVNGLVAESSNGSWTVNYDSNEVDNYIKALNEKYSGVNWTAEMFTDFMQVVAGLSDAWTTTGLADYMKQVEGTSQSVTVEAKSVNLSTKEVERAKAADKEIGQYGEGNIDLYDRPQYVNEDGSISTVDSYTAKIGKDWVVIPSVWLDENGEAYHASSEDEAREHYLNTRQWRDAESGKVYEGEYLGKFDTQEEADAYAELLHYAQEYYYCVKNGGETVTETYADLDKFIADTKGYYGETAEEIRKSFDEAGLDAPLFVDTDAVKNAADIAASGDEMYNSLRQAGISAETLRYALSTGDFSNIEAITDGLGLGEEYTEKIVRLLQGTYLDNLGVDGLKDALLEIEGITPEIQDALEDGDYSNLQTLLEEFGFAKENAEQMVEILKGLNNIQNPFQSDTSASPYSANAPWNKGLGITNKSDLWGGAKGGDSTTSESSATKINIELIYDTSGAKDAIGEVQTAADENPVEIKLSVGDTTAVIADVNSQIETLDGVEAQPNVLLRGVNTVFSKVNSLRQKLETLTKNWNINISVNSSTTTTKKTNTNGSKRGATDRTLANASGTSNFAGGVTLLGDEYSPTGDPRPELVVDNGEAFVAGLNGPEFQELGKGAVIYKYSDTKRILRNSSIKGKVPAFAQGLSGGGGSGSVPGKAKTTATTTVTASTTTTASTYEDAQKELEHLLNMHLISYQEYYNELAAMEEKYHSEIHADNETLWEYQESLFSAAEQAFDDVVDAADHSATMAESAFSDAARDFDYESMYTAMTQQLNAQKQIMDAVEQRIKELADAGVDENDSAMRELREQWQSAYESFADIADGMEDEIRNVYSESLDEVQGVYDTLIDASEEFAQNGYITVDTFQAICDMGVEYIKYLQDENGAITFNEEAIQRLIQAKVQDMAVTQANLLIDTIETYIAEGKALETLAYATDVATESTWALVYARLANLDLSDDLYNAFASQIRALQSLSVSAQQSVTYTRESASDLYQEQNDALESILDLIMDMVKSEVEDHMDALEDQKDAMQDLIDERKEMLDLQEESIDYEKQLADYTQEIAELQFKINQLSLDDSREAQAERAQLISELAELQGEATDYQTEHWKDKTEEALDDQYDAYEENIDKQIEALEDSISSQEKIYQLAVERIKSTTLAGLYNQLREWNYEQGLTQGRPHSREICYANYAYMLELPKAPHLYGAKAETTRR